MCRSGCRTAPCSSACDGSVALWLEDVGDPEPWPDADLADVARRLAAMPSVADGPRWLARDWLPRYLDLRAFRFDSMRPPSGSAATRSSRASRQARACSCTTTSTPGNIFRPGGEPVVIDWAFCGIGVPGADAGVLAGDVLFDGFYPVEEAEHLIGLVWDAYSGALDPALVPEAEYSFFVGNALRYGWAPAISEHFAAVYAALASAAAARLPSFA